MGKNKLRNKKCPYCDSQKKYKYCHGDNSTNSYIFHKRNKIKNILQDMDILKSFYVIHHYISHFQNNKKFPNDIEIPEKIIKAKHPSQKIIFPWHMEILAMEVLLHCPVYNPSDSAKKSLTKWDNLAEVRDIIFDIVEKEKLKDNDYLLFSIMQEQIWWHEIGLKFMGNAHKYFKVFSSKKIKKHIEKKLCIKIDEIIKFFLFMVIDMSKKKDAFMWEITEETDPVVKKYLNFFSSDMSNVKNKLKNAFEKTEYITKEFEMHPVIKITNTIFLIPINYIFLKMVPELLYYKLDKKGTFGQLLGESFEHYLSEIIEKNLDIKNIYRKEKSYKIAGKKNYFNTIDFFIENKEDDMALFIEAKTTRLSNQDVKNPGTSINKKIHEIAKAIKQTYKNIIYYNDGYYPDEYKILKHTFPIIVTIEDLKLFLLKNKIRKELKKIISKDIKNINEQKKYFNLLKTYDFEILSVDDLKDLLFFDKKSSLKSILIKKNKKKFIDYGFDGFIFENYKNKKENKDYENYMSNQNIQNIKDIKEIMYKLS